MASALLSLRARFEGPIETDLFVLAEIYDLPHADVSVEQVGAFRRDGKTND